MTANIKEKANSRKTSDSDHVRSYHIWGTDDPDVAIALLFDTAPENPKSYNLTHPTDDESLWDAEVSYKPGEVGQDSGKQLTIELTSPIQWSGSIGTTSVKRITSLQTTKYPNADDSPNFDNGIGFNGDGFDGVDVLVPTMHLSGRKILPVASLSYSYLKAIGEATGKTNDAPFFIWAAGEVLFLGMDFTQRDTITYDCTYEFDISPNATGLEIGGIKGITKKGWEYLWVLYDRKHEVAEKFVSQKARTVYVEKVYEETNFGALGLGGGS